jgi:hypothetical protein
LRVVDVPVEPGCVFAPVQLIQVSATALAGPDVAKNPSLAVVLGGDLVKAVMCAFHDNLHNGMAITMFARLIRISNAGARRES